MNNKVFNVKAYSQEQLAKAIDLAFFNQDDEKEYAASWSLDDKLGLIFRNTLDNGTPFPVKIDSKEAAGIAWKWLLLNLANDFMKDWPLIDAYNDIEGTILAGFRVYIHPNTDPNVLCIIRPSYLHYEKSRQS